MSIHHNTLIFERAIKASAARVYAAYAEKSCRERWSAPSPTAEVKVDTMDMRTGGYETGRCGPKGDLRWMIEIAYHYVEPDRRIVFTETVRERTQILTIALLTFDFSEDTTGRTRLIVTDQLTSLSGPESIQGHKVGYGQALDNLSRLFDEAGRTP